MSTVDKVKQIIVDQLGVDPSEVVLKLPLLMIWVQILWILWNQ